jgi:hypothetical protein
VLLQFDEFLHISLSFLKRQSNYQVKCDSDISARKPYWLNLGGSMEALTSVFSGVNWEAIVQLTLVGMIMLAGPVVIFVLVARGGDL